MMSDERRQKLTALSCSAAACYSTPGGRFPETKPSFLSRRDASSGRVRNPHTLISRRRRCRLSISATRDRLFPRLEEGTTVCGGRCSRVSCSRVRHLVVVSSLPLARLSILLYARICITLPLFVLAANTRTRPLMTPARPRVSNADCRCLTAARSGF
jgi:hypothetical protein